MTDLFDAFDPYPSSPGSRGLDSEAKATSQAAADATQPSASTLRALALRLVADMRSATPLEVVAASGLPRESMQPRLSELKAMGLLESTGERRRNPSGKSAAVLRLTERGRAAL